jgi:hypothetical protein
VMRERVGKAIDGRATGEVCAKAQPCHTTLGIDVDALNIRAFRASLVTMP